MFCIHCGKEIADGSQFCGFCGKSQDPAAQSGDSSTSFTSTPVAPAQTSPTVASVAQQSEKKSKLLLICGIAVTVLVLIGIIGALGSNSNQGAGKANTSIEINDRDTQKLEAFAGQVDVSATTAQYNVVDLYQRLQDNDAVPYTLNDKATAFLKAHPDLFPANDFIPNDLIDTSAEAHQILKSPFKYGDRLIIVEGSVVQIIETELQSGEIFSEINLIDSNLQQYYILYYGELDTVFDGDNIQVKGLPIGNSAFDNTAGGQTIVIVVAGSEVINLYDNMSTGAAGHIAIDDSSYVDPSTPTAPIANGSPYDDFTVYGYSYQEAAEQGWADEFEEIANSMGSDGESLTSRFLCFIDDCDKTYFTRDDLEGFDKEMTMLARNAPYAHEGRMFNNETIQNFFLNWKWYVGYIAPDTFQETMLNDYEKANKELVMAYEKEMGYK